MEEPPVVDGITPQASPEPSPESGVPQAPAEPVIPPAKEVSPELRSRMKFALIVFFGVPYVIYLLGLLFLLSILPDASGKYEYLIPIGSAVGVGGAGVLFLLGIMALARVLKKRKTLQTSIFFQSIFRVFVVMLPGIALGAVVPVFITAEPGLWISITDPEDITEIIAPKAITFSLEDAVAILERRGVKTISFGWDFDGDGEKNEDTVLPVATAVYPRKGVYDLVVRIEASDGKLRRIVRKVSIQKEVFEVIPSRPIVDQPVRFSVAHLVDLPEELKEVQWDFDSDGIADEVTSELEVVKTFVRVGIAKVSAVVLMQNQTQQIHERQIEVFEPSPLPFDVRIVTEPKVLVSPAPFQTIFKVVTDEPLRGVTWNFGGDEDFEGERVGQTFAKQGNYVVTADVKSELGDLAQLSTLVRVVNKLDIPDLSFNGTPEVDLKDLVIRGEVPLTLKLTPRSSLSLVEYSWELDDATSVGSTDTSLEAIYRRPGTYIITLLAQDPSGSAMRLPITVEVQPASTVVAIGMNPEGGVAPLDVVFDATDTRIPNETISGFEWLFGEEEEGQLPKPGGAIVNYTYRGPGTYIVKLFARTIEGNVYDTTRTIVVRPQVLDACFRASRTRGKAPNVGVKFTMDCTAGVPDTILWDFNDGAQTDERNPSHVFEAVGEYTVTLELRDKSGSVSRKTLLITVEE